MTEHTKFFPLLLICWFPLVLQAQFTLIPDSNFEQRLIDLGIDTSAAPDGQISTFAANAVTGTLDVSDLDIQELKGIEAFTSITTLDCSRNEIDSLDVSLLSNLLILRCQENHVLEYLNMGNANNLDELQCGYSRLKELDLTGQSELWYLDCKGSDLEYLDISACENIYWLDLLGSLQLRALDVTHLGNLQFLMMSSYRINYLDLTQNIDLRYLQLDVSEMYSVDLRNDHYDLQLFQVSGSDSSCVLVDDVEWFEENFSETAHGVVFSEQCNSCDLVNVWKGGSGNWTDPAKWSSNQSPSGCQDVNITIPGSEVVIPYNSTVSVATLAMHQEVSLHIRSGVNFTIDGSPSEFKRSGIYLWEGAELTNQGQITVSSANQYGIHVNESTFLNEGDIEIDTYGITTIEPSGLHINGGSTATNNGQITITGSVIKPDNNGLRIANNASLHNTSSGTISIHDISGMKADGVDNLGVLVNDGTIAVDSVADGYGLLNAMNGTGYYTGTGDIDVDRCLPLMGVVNDTTAIWRGSNEIQTAQAFINHGSLTPGSSPGVVSVLGDYTKGSTSIDSFEIFGRGGAGQSTGHDQIQVSGDLSLAGILKVKTDSSFTAGDQESIILYTYTGSLTGTFDSIKFDGLVPWEIDYSVQGIVRLIAPPCGHPDFEALMLFYDSLDGEHWIENSGWSAGANSSSCDPCEDNWYGLICDNGRVVSIDLSTNNLVGKLPSLRDLDSLTSLKLSTNEVSGGINSILPLIGLVDIKLAGNNFSGTVPAEIFSLPRIEQIDLSSNEFDSLALELQPSVTLHTIKLNNNVNLHSKLPLAFPSMINLDTLHVQGCSFYDCFPPKYYRICGVEVDFTNNLLPDFISFCESEGEGSCSTCEEGPIAVDDTPIAPNTFLKVSGVISSSGTIVESKVIFHSDEYLEFYPGFSVDSSSVFISEIVPCGHD